MVIIIDGFIHMSPIGQTYGGSVSETRLFVNVLNDYEHALRKRKNKVANKIRLKRGVFGM